ncbi:MAG TPA: conjugal transfer protein TraF [Nitrospira sp.]|nr:conjugal transfer protein TraF [Nitrospira sp.]
MSRRCSVLLWGLSVLLPTAASADFDRLFQPIEPPSEWKGYYYYQDPLPDVDMILPQQLPQTPAMPLQPEQFKDAVALKEALKQLPVEKIDLQALPAAWLKVLLTAKREAALDQQTESNLLAYLRVHKETFNRSQRFTDMWQTVVWTHPELDFTAGNPSSIVGHEIYAEQKKVEEEQLLTSMRDRMGLFFFYTSTCPFCQKQSQLLKVFADTYGISVKPVTRDGRSLVEWPDSEMDNGMGDQIGVNKVPVIYMAIPEEQFLVPIGAGVLTVQELHDRMVMILKQRYQLKRGTGKS